MTRIVLADDSATARAMLRSILHEHGSLQVIAEATNGAEAVELVDRLRPDLVVMDVHMPVLDGLEATRQIMTRAPTPIIIVSSITREDVDLSLSATQAGALLALPKPTAPGTRRFEAASEELRTLASAMAQVKVVRRWPAAPAAHRWVRRRRIGGTPELVAIAASTGGPAALRHIFGELPRDFPAPILVVQHIARDFTAGLVEWLARGSDLAVKLASDDEPLRAGCIYVAPDDQHLGVAPDLRVRLSGGPPDGGFRPSATHLFASAGHLCGSRLIAVVLTGMGSDGTHGLEQARAAGSYVIAQDESSSVVFGMAGEAVRRRLVDVVLPLEQIAPRLVDLMMKESHAS